MPTFLELAQTVGSESGTVENGRLASVTDPNPRVRKVVRWTATAYRQIQNAKRGWFWLQDEVETALAAGKQRYSATDLGLDRFSEWTVRDETEDRFSLYPADAQAQEHQLVFQDWDSFYVTRLRGAQTAGMPRFFSINPKGEIVVSPTPDAAYVFRGPYRKAPQELRVDADVPEMPAHFHDIIVDAALVLLTTHDEAAPTLSIYQLRTMRQFSDLEREQSPRIQVAGTFC